MSDSTLFDASYESRKRPILHQTLERLQSIYSENELKALRIDSISREVLSLRSGRGFVNRDILETVLGNLLECVAPGSHNAPHPETQKTNLTEAIEEVADQLYAMITQSFLAVADEEDLEDRALEITFALLWELPRLKERALWNRFSSLKDPAVWDAYLFHKGISPKKVAELDISKQIDEAILERDFQVYRDFLKELDLEFAFDYQMQLVMSAYPGWRVLFYHDIAYLLTRSGPLENHPNLFRVPVPLLPRAIAELGGRYYQADLHPETEIGDANFLEHPHRGVTTGQTGVIGLGCVIYPCTLGGLTVKIKQRHPIIGNFVTIGTDASFLGPVHVGDHSIIGANTEIHGFVETGSDCHIGSSVVIGTVKSSTVRPGAIRLGKDVRVGDGTIIENTSAIDLIIPDRAEIPARSHVANDGFGHPRYVG
jgi:serine O-acetyltransferase